MRISKQSRTSKMKTSVEYSPGRAGVAVYGQRYGGTIKPTSPEACGIPHIVRSIRSLFFSALFNACIVDECRVSLVKCECIDCFLYRLILECAATGLAAHVLIRYTFECATHQLRVYIHTLFLLRFLEYVASISIPSLPCDVSGSIGGGVVTSRTWAG